MSIDQNENMIHYMQEGDAALLDMDRLCSQLQTVAAKDTPLRQRLDQELQVAAHLHEQGVPVLMPVHLSQDGPYELEGNWMTFWEYVPQTTLKFPSPSEAAGMVNALSLAMENYTGELPVLGVWERIHQSVIRLSGHSDERVQRLLQTFGEIDKQMRSESMLLVPCHGDAHARNLMPSPRGWLWMDFEDISLMPRFWDQASFVTNLAMFKGEDEPTFRYMLNRSKVAGDRKAFGFAVIARILMSTLGNFDYAIAGHGDMEFADAQLELAGGFINRMEQIMAE